MNVIRFAHRYSDVAGWVWPDESDRGFAISVTPPTHPGAALVIETGSGSAFLATYLGRTNQGEPVFRSDNGIKLLYSDARYEEDAPFPAFAPTALERSGAKPEGRPPASPGRKGRGVPAAFPEFA
ncbi:hypothetical protein [Roseomonas sp. USHLN139]|uniref:hypothetical protein n=1 Tax=Roseomonas sp. USHLN139 TaxID=3081298 RepID=UPI003B02CCB9